MKIKEDIDAQCPQCLSVLLVTENTQRWKPTFVVFNNLPKKLCYGCKNKKTEGSDNGVQV